MVCCYVLCLLVHSFAVGCCDPRCLFSCFLGFGLIGRLVYCFWLLVDLVCCCLVFGLVCGGCGWFVCLDLICACARFDLVCGV